MITASLHNQFKHLQVDGKKMVLRVHARMDDGSGPRLTGETYPVKGKREANKLCKQLTLKPWNF